jgi:hypothetical protein
LANCKEATLPAAPHGKTVIVALFVLIGFLADNKKIAISVDSYDITKCNNNDFVVLVIK